MFANEPPGNLREQKRKLRKRSVGTFVARNVFCDLLLSRKKLLRSDEPHKGLRGLLEPETGRQFLIEEEILFAGGV